MKPFGVGTRNWVSNYRKCFVMLTLFRDSYFHAFLIGFTVVGVPLAVSTGLFA